MPPSEIWFRRFTSTPHRNLVCSRDLLDAGAAYATRVFWAPPPTSPLVSIQANPATAPGRGGIILPVEDGRWIVTLSGARGGEPTDDPDAFTGFALGRSSPSPPRPCGSPAYLLPAVPTSAPAP